MNAADLGQLLKEYPEMLDDGKKFAAILRDVYPSEKGNVNQMIIAYNAGVVSMLRKSDLDSLLTSRIMSLLMNDYGIAEERARWAAKIWIEAYNYFQHEALREREQPKAASNAKAEKAPKVTPAKPSEFEQSTSETKGPIVLTVETDSNCFEVEETDSGCVITKYVGSETGQVIIPAYINGKRITSIGFRAFKDCKSLTSVAIPEGVTVIWMNAFEGCTSLTSITIPNSVMRIGSESFKNCTNLASVTIPKSVIDIGGKAFEGTLWLKERGEFEIVNQILLAYQGNAEEVIIPDSVWLIGGSAFKDCTNLTNIIIPNSVSRIGIGAFNGCTSLTRVTIPNSVVEIGSSAFRNCTSLTNINIPNSVTAIRKNTFLYCDSLTSITIPNSVTEIEQRAFQGCAGLTNVVIPNSVTKIEPFAFSNCASLTNMTIPESVIKIDKYCFNFCENLAKFTVLGNSTEITNDVFTHCNQAMVIYAPAGSRAEQYAKANYIPFQEL